MEVQKQKENFAFRDEVFWWTHFNDTKNNALFHMNGQDYFKEVKKIREFLHDVSSSCALLGDLLWLTAHLFNAYILIQFKKLHHKGSLFYADQFSKKETGGKKLSYRHWLYNSQQKVYILKYTVAITLR